MEFLINNKAFGTVQNLVKSPGYDKFEIKTYLGGITREIYAV